jgi:carbonic anhydrase
MIAMDRLSHLFDSNRAWAAKMTRADPQFFQRLADQQAPELLWIGCSDSRVPANQITGLLPGEVFVQRNVANLVVHTDLNCLSTVQYAVDVLKVKHIVVCGHYGCGGVLAALRSERFGLVDNWLRHVQDVRRRHQAQLDALAAEAEQHDRLCELNVIEQVVNVGQTTVVRDAWSRGANLSLHGWIYDVNDGLLRDLGMCVADETGLFRNAQAASELVLRRRPSQSAAPEARSAPDSIG